MSVYKSEIDVSEQTSAEQKIKSMVECKDFRKGIIQLQWGHKKMKMQMEDLNNKIRDIRRLKLTEEQRDVSAISLILVFKAYLRSCWEFCQDNGGFFHLYFVSISDVFYFKQWSGMKHIFDSSDTKQGFFLAASNNVWLLPSLTTDRHSLKQTHLSSWLYSLFFSCAWYWLKPFPNM